MQILSKKFVLISSFILLTMMFAIVTFVVNPLIDGADGAGLLKLQLAFDKDLGLDIIDGWGTAGRENFERLIFTDYLYAFTYAVFLASLVFFLIVKKGRKNNFAYNLAGYLALIAGLFDWVENTMELMFISDPANFSNALFFLHSLVAALKWAAIIVTVTAIVILLTKKTATQRQSR